MMNCNQKSEPSHFYGVRCYQVPAALPGGGCYSKKQFSPETCGN